jgi:uncharacterized protein
MKIWAIADLHLSFGVSGKKMDVFGPHWEAHADRIQSAWTRLIHPDDLILIPGDISWAMRLEEALPDLLWIDRLPGTKVLLKGNHDYWWGSLSKIVSQLPPSLHLIQNNCFVWKRVAIGGARLWDTIEYTFAPYIEIVDNPRERKKEMETAIQEDLNQKIFDRELQRLDMSLSKMPADATMRIAMTHYPPIGADLRPSRASQILERHRVQLCVFGHLHNLKSNLSLFGENNGIQYILASADYLHFQPILLCS